VRIAAQCVGSMLAPSSSAPIASMGRENALSRSATIKSVTEMEEYQISKLSHSHDHLK
jgi:hypothetical protein